MKLEFEIDEKCEDCMVWFKNFDIKKANQINLRRLHGDWHITWMDEREEGER